MDDLISRQEAINAMCWACGLLDCYKYDCDKDEQVIICPEHYALSTLPSAQPETGYWISARDEDGRHMWLICSECRAKETNLKAKYCPVCGRKMA